MHNANRASASVTCSAREGESMSEFVIDLRLSVREDGSFFIDSPDLPMFSVVADSKNELVSLTELLLPAYLKAMDIGVTTLEMDAVITKDSQVLMSHEPFFNHEISTKKNGTPVTEEEEMSLNIY